MHGFPVGLVQCESNMLGIVDQSTGANIGSGGWANIIEKYTKAKTYCDRPFEVAYRHGKKVHVPIHGEWIGDHRNGTHPREQRNIMLRCQSATLAELPPASLDAVITDPPYFGNVQYAELMDFCYVWLRRLVGHTVEAFTSPSTRNASELTGNVTMDRDLRHFTAGLAEVFRRMAHALKPGAPFTFTYHHNTLEAYYPIVVAMLDAGLVCSASLPCPAEMGGSIHINKTGSSIVDTVFVCRSTGKIPRRWLADTPEAIAALVCADLEQLREGAVTPTRGDLRCILFGHVIRMAIWHLRHTWNRHGSIPEKLTAVADCIHQNGGIQAVEQYLEAELSQIPQMQRTGIREDETLYRLREDDISF